MCLVGIHQDSGQGNGKGKGLGKGKGGVVGLRLTEGRAQMLMVRQYEVQIAGRVCGFQSTFVEMHNIKYNTLNSVNLMQIF